MKRLYFPLFIFLLCSSLFFHQSIVGQGSYEDGKAQSIEDWETGDFSQFDWEFEGDADWFVTDADSYEGVYSAQSSDIGDGQTAGLYLEFNVYAEDTISFWYKVSSESGWDYLQFYIDDELIDEWSGEIPWSYFDYVVPVGTHVFKWVYDKDFSISSGQDAAWIDYIVFPPEEIQANFVADTTVICEGDVVFFTDLSIGPVTEWSWIFEGAMPATSTDQNPVVGYLNSGEWDVFLEVTDGVEIANHYEGGYIQVGETPAIANTPIGISNLCASWGNTTYTTTPMGSGVTSYDWTLDPPEAGTISGNGGTNVTIVWEPDFLGTVDLAVAGINYCGVGVPSIPLTITRYLPDVNLILPAYVALPEPPFELTGGTPPGGEYSGPGVSNGWFDPAAAGMGEHTITYTYTDPNLCTNSATDIITVTEFIGIDEFANDQNVSLYPNPSSGSFSMQMASMDQHRCVVTVYNSLNAMVYREENVLLGQGQQTKFDLNLPQGIYFIEISGPEQEIRKKLIIRN